MKKAVFLFLTLLLAFGGCCENKEPGNAYPIMIQYDGVLYFHRGKICHELPEDSEYIGKVKQVQTTDIENDFEGNEAGYIYKNEENNTELWFRYKEWDVKKDGEKEPYLLLIRE